MENQERIVEINGVKMSVDLREAKVVESYKVGDSIKILVKSSSYGNEFASYIGTIIGFDDFKEHPTIVIAYLETSYDGAKIKYCYFNSETKDVEVCPLNDWDIPITKQQIMDEFDMKIRKLQEGIEDIKIKKGLFTKLFGKYFEAIEKDLIKESLIFNDT